MAILVGNDSLILNSIFSVLIVGASTFTSYAIVQALKSYADKINALQDHNAQLDIAPESKTTWLENQAVQVLPVWS